MSAFDSSKSQFNDEQLDEIYRRSRERIDRRMTTEPEPTSMPGVVRQEVETTYSEALRDYYRPAYQAVSDFGVGVRRAITNQMPGGIASAMGAVYETLPSGLQSGLAQAQFGPLAGAMLTADPTRTVGQNLLEMGGQMQSGLLSIDDQGNVVNLTGEQLDAMFYDPEGVARQAGEVAGQVISQVGVSLVPGGQFVGLSLAVTSAVGSTVDQYYQYTKANGLEYDPKMAVAVGTIGGLAEAFLNKIPGAVRARLRINPGIGGADEAVRKVVQRAYIEALRTGNARAGTAILKSAFPGFVSEATEEGFTEAIQTGVSAMYRGFGGEQGLTMSEVVEAAKAGALYGGFAGAATTGTAGGIRAASAAKAGQRDRATIAAETGTVADERRIKQALMGAGLSEQDAAKLIGGIERARVVGGTKAARQKPAEAAGEATGDKAPVDPSKVVEDPTGVLKAALGDTRDSDLTQEGAIQAGLDGGLLPNNQEKEFILSGEEDVDTEIGGPRPDLRVDPKGVRQVAARLLEKFPKLAQAIRDKGRLTVQDLALFLAGDADYLTNRVVKKELVEHITALVDAKSKADRDAAEVSATIAEMEAVIASGTTTDGKPLTEDDKDRIRSKIDELSTDEAPRTDTSEEIDEVSAAVEAVAPVGGLSNLKMDKLIELAARLGIRGRTKMRKQELIDAIQSRLDEGDKTSETLTEAESVVADSRIEEIEQEMMGIQEDLERAREAGDTEAEMEYERVLGELEQEYQDLIVPDLDSPDRWTSTDPLEGEFQSREADATESDAPKETVEATEQVEAEPETTGDPLLDAFNADESTSGNAKLVEESKLGPVAKKAIAFIRKMLPGVEVVAYTDTDTSQRGFTVKGKIYVRVGTAKSEQAALNRGGRRYRRMVNRALLDGYIQTVMHENVHMIDQPGERSGALAAVDVILGDMSEDEQARSLVLIQGAKFDEEEKTRRELRAEILTSIPAARRAGVRSLYDADATALQRGLDRLRRIVTNLRGPKSIEKAVLTYYQEVANAVTSTSVPRTRVEGDAADLEMQARGRHDTNQEVRDAAAGYARSAGIEYDEMASREGIVEVDRDRAMAIADLYNAAQNIPSDPDVVAAYNALETETIAQYEYLAKAGYQMIPWGSPGQPYANSREMMADVRDNKRIFYYKSINEFEQGFGSDPAVMDELIKSNPMLRKAGGTVLDSEGKPYEQTVNDIFRAIHDIFGHAKEGHSFGPRGEENAWRQHARMFTPLARQAMTNETRAQNSWVNFGDHLRRPDGTLPLPGDPDFVHPADRPFAPQKAVALPDWVTAVNGLDVDDWPRRQMESPIEFQTRAARHVGGKTSKNTIVTEDLRDSIPETLRNGGLELPYARGTKATLIHGTPAHDRGLRSIRVSYPIGQFTMEDAVKIRDEVVAEMGGIVEAGPRLAANAFVSALPNNAVVTLTRDSVEGGLPVFDPDLLMASFEDQTLREDKRFWYEASGDAIESRTLLPDSMKMRLISDLLSATSPLTKVIDNFLRAYAIAGDFLYQGFSRVSLPTEDLVRRAIANAYRNSNSFKASSFGDTMDFVAGGSESVPLTTNDIWVAYMFGMRKRDAEGKMSGDNIAFSDPYAYMYTAMYLARLTARLNERIQSSPAYAEAKARHEAGKATLEDEVLMTPWTPWQLQAYPWSHVSSSGTFDEAMDTAWGLLKAADHPAAVTTPDGVQVIDMSRAGASQEFGRILQPNLEARFSTLATLEVGGDLDSFGTERYARKMIDETLKNKDLTDAERKKLIRARGLIYRELNAMLRFLAGSNAGGPFFSMSGMADVIAGNTAKPKAVSTNSIMDELVGAMMYGVVTPELRQSIKDRIAARQANSVVGADPEVLDPVDVSVERLEQISKQRNLKTVGRKANPTAGFETVKSRTDDGVRAFNIGYGLRNNGTGMGGSYNGLISPNLLLSMFGIPNANRNTFLRILGYALGEAEVTANNWYVGDQQGKNDKPVTIFTRQGGLFSGDEIADAERAANKHGGFVQFMSDATGSHVLVHGVHLESDEMDQVLEGIGADVVQTGYAERLSVKRGNNNYGVEKLLERFVDEDIEAGSEWRATLNDKQRAAVNATPPDVLRRALSADATVVSETGNLPGGVRKALAGALKASRSFRVHVAVGAIQQRNQQLHQRLSQAVNQARQEVTGLDIQFQQRRADINTPEFKAWFRDSVVVGKDGKPLTVFHGTGGQAFDTFRAGFRNALGGGIYFTDSPSSAANYSRMKPDVNRRVIPVRLRIENPFRIQIPMQGIGGIISEMQRQFADNPEVMRSLDHVMEMEADEMQEITRILKRLGHDGVIATFEYTSQAGGEETYYVAFDSVQVKSAEVTSMNGPTEDPRYEYQRRQNVNSPEFKEWFGNSTETSDENGVPKMLYHGTKNPRAAKARTDEELREIGPNLEDFEIFDTYAHGILGPGSYFAEDPEIADIYSNSRREITGSRIFPVYLRMQNPFIIDAVSRETLRIQIGLRHPESKSRAENSRDFPPYEDGEELQSILMGLGYDGIIVRNREPDIKDIYVVWDSNHIKSAIVTSDAGPLLSSDEINMQSRITFDDKKGMGSVPIQADRQYSMTKSMTKDEFHRLVPAAGIEEERSSNIRQKIESGESVAPPWLQVEWNAEEHRWEVTGHEGRHRTIAIDSIRPGAEFPVRIFLREQDRYSFPVEDGVPRRRPRTFTREEENAPFLGQRGSSSHLTQSPVPVRSGDMSQVQTIDGRPSPGPVVEMQARVSAEEEIEYRNNVATRFKNAATGYGIPEGAIEFEFENDLIRSVSVYDSDQEERNLIGRYSTTYGSPTQWAEDIRDIVMSNPEQYGGWTKTLDMDYDEPYETDDFGDEVLLELMSRGVSRTEDIDNVVKTLREERSEGRPAGMALGHDAKAFGRWFRSQSIVFLMDEWHTLTNMVQDIQSVRGSRLPSKLDPLTGLRLAPGKVAEANRLFRVRTVDRVQNLMRERGVTNRQVGRFMAANHALERNERIREINRLRSDIHADDLAKLNCGISDETANKMLADHAADGKAASIEEIATMLQEISYETAQIAKFAGLITDEDFNRITGRYKFYIPMNVTGSEDGRMVTDPVDSVMDRLRRGAGARGTGSQLDVATGSRSKLKYTLGRKESEATVKAITDGALAALFNDRMITQAEAINNRIANRLLRLVEKYPTKVMRLATTRDVSERRIDPDKDVVVTQITNPESRDDILAIRLEETREVGGVLHQRGDVVYVVINDPHLVEKLGGGRTGAERKQRFMAAVHMLITPARVFTQMIRFTSTQFMSLDFTFTQPLLDGQTALLASMEQGHMSAKQMVREMSKRMPAVCRTIVSSEFRAKVMPEDEAERGGAASGPLADYWNEFREVGGKQQWFEISTIDDFVKEMSSVVSADPTSKARRVGRGVKRFTVDMYNVLNDLGDNMWRFSYYVTLRENGVSAEEAAVLARNLTVDFSKKGELGAEISSLYAFFNAAVQGNVRTYQQLFKGLVDGKGPARTGFTFLTALGTLSALALQYMGGGDEDDSGVPDYLEQIPEWERRRSIIIPYGRDESGKIQYAKIRLQYGLEIPYLLGFGLVEVAYGRRSPLDIGADMLTNVITAFNPLGGTPLDSSHGWLRMALPDLADAALDIQTNRNFQGRQIYYGDSPLQAGGSPRSKVGSAKESFGVDWNSVAKLVNWITGGDEAHRGYVDMQPEIWRYLAGTFGGSSLRNIERLVDVGLGLYRGTMLGEEFPDANDYPIIRRYFGEGPSNPYPTNYYEIRRRVQSAEQKIKDYEGQPRQAKEIRSSVDGSAAMIKRMKDSEKMVRQLRAKIRDLDDRMRALPRDSAERKAFSKQHADVSARLAEVQRKMIKYYVDKGGKL